MFQTLHMFIITSNCSAPFYKAKQHDDHLFHSKYFWPQSCVTMPSLPKQSWAHSQTHNHQFPVDDSSLLLYHPTTASAPFLHPSILQPRRRDACFLPHLPHFLSLTAEILFTSAKALYLPIITHHPSPDTPSGVKPLPVPPSDQRSQGAIMSCPAPWIALVHLELRSRPHGGTVRLLWMLSGLTWSCHSRLTMTHSGTVPLTGKAWHDSV